MILDFDQDLFGVWIGNSGSGLEVELDRFLDVGDGFLAGFPLALTARELRTDGGVPAHLFFDQLNAQFHSAFHTTSAKESMQGGKWNRPEGPAPGGSPPGR